MFINLWTIWSLVILFCILVLVLASATAMVMKARRQPIIIVDENRRVHGYNEGDYR